MKKIRCLLVDDEPLAIALLQQHIRQLDFLEVSATCPNAVQALDILTRHPIDLLFLDIRLPTLSGVDFLKSLRHPPQTILTTAYRDYAVDGYELEVIDYLLKPITFDRFFKAVERYLRSTRQIQPLAGDSPANEAVSIYLKSGHKHLKINTADIVYIESVKDYVKLHLRENQVMAKHKISELENELPEKGFLRIHRSFIVNLRHITAFTAATVELGALELPIGENYKAYVMQWLTQSG